MNKPKIKPARPKIQSLFGLTMDLPSILPIGVIAISTPNRKIARPTTINKAPSINLVSSTGSSGVNVKFKMITIIVIGNTAVITSFNLAVITFKWTSSP